MESLGSVEPHTNFKNNIFLAMQAMSKDFSPKMSMAKTTQELLLSASMKDITQESISRK